MQRGGCSIYYKNNMIATRRKDLEINVTEQSFEIVALEITRTKHKKNIICICIYRSPRYGTYWTNFIDYFYGLCDKIDFNKNEVIMGGDWNINLLTDNPKRKQLLEILDIFNLQPIPNNQITHENSCIDFFVGNKEGTGEVRTVPKLSNHLGIELKLPTIEPCNEINKNEKIKFTKSNLCTFRQCCTATDWTSVYKIYGANDKCKELCKMINKSYEQSLEIKIVKPGKKRNEWITDEVRNSSAKKRMFHQNYKTNPINANLIRYKTHCINHKKLVKETKKKFEIHEYNKCENDQKLIWRLVNKKRGKIQEKIDIKIASEEREIISKKGYFL